MVNRPPHYNQYGTEVIDMMTCIWGPELVSKYCEINAFKYRMRLGHKAEMEIDFAKEQWYMKKAEELRSVSSKQLGA
jgi:hypothetical protein